MIKKNWVIIFIPSKLYIIVQYQLQETISDWGQWVITMNYNFSKAEIKTLSSLHPEWKH